MGKDMTITFGRYQLRPYDRRNWCLWEFREPRESRATKDRSARWFCMDEYFQDVGMAIRRCAEYELRADGTEFDADHVLDALDHVESTVRDLVGSVSAG